MTDSEHFRIIHAVMTGSSRSDDEDVREIWNTFFADTGNLIRRCVYRRLKTRHDVEDVEQDVWRIVIVAIRNASYEPRRGPFDAWMGTVVLNGVKRSMLMRRNRLRMVSLNYDEWVSLIDVANQPPGGIGPDGDTEELCAFVDKVLNGFKERERRVFKLYVEGKTSREIGAVLGTSEENARTILSRSRRLMRSAVEARKCGISEDFEKEPDFLSHMTKRMTISNIEAYVLDRRSHTVHGLGRARIPSDIDGMTPDPINE